jgi:type I restriction enzyme S subunit
MTDELPEGWATSLLPEAVYFAGRIGWRGLKAEEYTRSGVMLLSVHNLNNGPNVDFTDVNYVSIERYEESPEIKVRVNDVLLTKDGAGIGKTGFVATLPGEATVNSSLLLLRSLAMLQPKFLFYSLIGPRMQSLVKERITGSTTPHLFQKDIKHFELLIPPLAEQQRIVAKVEALLAHVNTARQQLAKVPPILKRFRQSVLAAACSGCLTADWREEQSVVEPASELAKRLREDKEEWFKTDFEKRPKSDLPSMWEYVALGNLGNWSSGGTPSKGEAAFWDCGTVSWVTPKDMKRSIIADSEDHITERALSDTNIRLLPAGSLLFVVRGMILAHSFPVAITSERVTINQDMRAISPHRELCGAYLLRALQAESLNVLHAVREATHGTRRLESETLKSWPIPLPPLAEQHEIVRRVETLFRLADAIEKRVAAAAVRAEKLTQATLAKAFRGELVPTEAELARREGRAYEPASALLERIRAERQEKATASTGERKPRRRAKKIS